MSNHYVFNAEPEELPEIIEAGKKLTPFLFNVMTGRDNPTDEMSTDESIKLLKAYLDMLDLIIQIQKDFEILTSNH